MQQRSCELCQLLELLLLAAAQDRPPGGTVGPAEWPPKSLLPRAQLLQTGVLGSAWPDAMLQGAEGQRADELVCSAALEGTLSAGHRQYAGPEALHGTEPSTACAHSLHVHQHVPCHVPSTPSIHAGVQADVQKPLLQALLVLLDALDLPAVLAGIAEGAWQPSRQRTEQVTEELETWLAQAAPVHGPLLLAWAAAVLQAFPQEEQREPLQILKATLHSFNGSSVWLHADFGRPALL